MRIAVMYRQNSEYARQVEEFLHDFSRRSSAKVEVVNPDTRDGIAMATLYDIMTYPAVLALNEEGSVIKSWQGDGLPLMDELAAYARA